MSLIRPPSRPVSVWVSLMVLFMGAFGLLIASAQNSSRVGMAISVAFLAWVILNAIKAARMGR